MSVLSDLSPASFQQVRTFGPRLLAAGWSILKMKDVATNPDPSSPTSSNSRQLPPIHSPTSPDRTHVMSTRSSDGLPRQQQPPQQRQQQQQQHHSAHSISSPTEEAHGLSSVPGRLTRKRARSINVDEANHPRIDELSIRSPAQGGPPPPPGAATDLICICPSPPKVPRPRNGMCSPCPRLSRALTTVRIVRSCCFPPFKL